MTLFVSTKNSRNLPIDAFKGYTISVKREDLLHPIVSGNKFRKLKYNFLKYSTQNNTTVLTFGGAFSNHLAATAHAGKTYQIPTLGVVRGEEWAEKIEHSDTLKFCQSCGMELFFVSREAYHEKDNNLLVQQLMRNYQNLEILPEGGSNKLAVKGCKEILTPEDDFFDTICCCVGTGGTLAGLAEAAKSNQYILGFNALKHASIDQTIKKLTKQHNWSLISSYTFGGYAKVTRELIDFMNAFYQQYQIPLDPVYTGKMLFGIFDLIKSNKWIWGKKILVIHSGGLQGINPMNQQLQKKGLPLLNYI